MEFFSDLFNFAWVLSKFIFNQSIFYLSKLFSFIFRIRCKGCKHIDHVEDYFSGHYKEKYWCIPLTCYMIWGCYYRFLKKNFWKKNKKKT
jgi:hypothetical protein